MTAEGTSFVALGQCKGNDCAEEALHLKEAKQKHVYIFQTHPIIFYYSSSYTFKMANIIPYSLYNFSRSNILSGSAV
jgi:hypothetical protein